MAALIDANIATELELVDNVLRGMIADMNAKAPNVERADVYYDPPNVIVGGTLEEGQKRFYVGPRHMIGASRFRRSVLNSMGHGAWTGGSLKHIKNNENKIRGMRRTFLYSDGDIFEIPGRTTTIWRMYEYTVFPELDHIQNQLYLALNVIELIRGD